MPKGTGRPFDKQERSMAQKGSRKATSNNEARDRNRANRDMISKGMIKLGLAPYFRSGTTRFNGR